MGQAASKRFEALHCATCGNTKYDDNSDDVETDELPPIGVNKQIRQVSWRSTASTLRTTDSSKEAGTFNDSDDEEQTVPSIEQKVDNNVSMWKLRAKAGAAIKLFGSAKWQVRTAVHMQLQFYVELGT